MPAATVPDDIQAILEDTDLEFCSDMAENPEDGQTVHGTYLGRYPELSAGLQGCSASPFFVKIDDLYSWMRKNKEKLHTEFGMTEGDE